MPLLLSRVPLITVLLAALPAGAQDRADPSGLIPAARPGLGDAPVHCDDALPVSPLMLPELIDIALCRNPSTAVSWAAVRGAAADVGVARSDYYPQATVGLGPQLTAIRYFNQDFPGGNRTSTSVNSSANLAIDYLLFDFGGRTAQVDAARAAQRAARASYADTAQTIAINTITAYNALQAGLASETAAAANVEFLRQALDNARARRAAGVATSADALQAETAYEQAQFTLVQARGTTQTARGQLAVTIGLLPQTVLRLAPPPPLVSNDLLSRDVGGLIAAAERLRPDLVAAREQAAVAEANLRSARALYRPSIGASASTGGSYASTQSDSITSSVGVSLSVPLFTGYRNRYQVAGAQAALDQATAQAQVASQSAALAVWSNYTGLDTQLKSLASARALIVSAQASADIAQGRFKAGVGTVTDVLNAAAALATARQQLVSAEFGVRDAQAQLARAIGNVGEAVERGGG